MSSSGESCRAGLVWPVCPLRWSLCLLILVATGSLSCVTDRELVRELGEDREWFGDPVLRPETRELALSSTADHSVYEVDSDPVFAIGAAEGDRDRTFGDVAGVLVVRREDLEVLVLDRLAKRVAVFATDGSVRRLIGQAGQGPGEFRDPRRMLEVPWLPGAFAVWDPGLLRVTVISSEGVVLGSHAVMGGRDAAWRTAWSLVDVRSDSAGFVTEFRSRAEHVSPDRQRGFIVRATRAMAEREDTAVVFKFPPVTVDTTFEAGAPVVYLRGPGILAPVVRWDVARDGTVALAPGAPREVYLFPSRGEPATRLRSRDWRPVAVDHGHRLASTARRIDEGIISPPAEMSVEEVESHLRDSFATILGAVTAVLWRGPAELWILDADPANTADGSGRLLHGFDRTGRTLGAVLLPPQFAPFGFHEDLVYGVVHGPLGMQFVHFYRMPAEVGRAPTGSD